MKHRYGKPFAHDHEANETANGFRMLPGIDRLGPVEVSVVEHGNKYWVYVDLEGEVDPDGVLAATGYQRID